MTPRRAPASVPPLRRRLLLAGWLVATAIVLARAVQIQVVQGDEWQTIALDQQRGSEEIVAPRGAVLDRDGVELAVSRETYRVGIDPDALDDREAAVRLLRDVLGISAATARRVTDPGDPWHVVPDRYPPSVREGLEGVRGVHLERQVERFYPHGDLARGILGGVRDEEGRGGIEQTFDEVLRGRPGRRVLAKDSEGRPIPGVVYRMEPPRPGGDVQLTIDLDLQEIAHEALADAVEETGARGGDIVVADPHTGEILALVSIEDGHSGSLAAINTPYEPGSTFKPFTVAALLERRRASLGDTVDAEGGRWIAPDGRPLSDIVPHDSITLAEALRVSSNVGVAKAALRLTSAEQYQVLRDFGFGVPTGIPLPGEDGGRLRRPAEWTARSPVALAIGYEAAVTPLQMVMAYGALANGGRLMEPRLVREVRDGTGSLLEAAAPRELRRVVRRDVTTRLGRVLVDVVEEGTGTRARMGTFQVAGKSGTSRVYVTGSGYESGRYFSSFAGFFPADDPQLVVFVKLDSPDGSYYGGATAAPVTRATMEAVLAARRAPIDRSALARSMRSLTPAEVLEPPVRFASLSVDGAAGTDALPARLEADGPQGLRTRATGHREVPARVAVPDVGGLPARVAARRLHAVGLRVRWQGVGPAVRVVPEPGSLIAPGDTVRLVSRSGASPPGERP